MPFDFVEEEFGRELLDLVEERRTVRGATPRRARTPRVGDRLKGKLAEEFTAGGTDGVVNIWAGTPGQETYTGQQIQNVGCWCLSSGTIAAGTKVKIEVTSGGWDIYAYDCG